MSRKPDADAENPEWTSEDFKKAKPADQLPAAILSAFPKTRGPQAAPKKIPVSLRLSAEVVRHFKATGPGWQRRIDDALKEIANRQSDT